MTCTPGPQPTLLDRPCQPRVPLLLALVAGAVLPWVAVATQAATMQLRIDGLAEPLLATVRPVLEIAQYDGVDVSQAQVERLCEGVPGELSQALEPLGYYEAEARCRVEPATDGWRTLVQVQTGEPVRVRSLKLDLPAEARANEVVQAALAGFGPREGEVLDEGRYEQGKAALQAALIGQGYFDAKLTTHRIEVTRASRSADIALAIETGTRYRIGVVRFEGSQFREGFLKRYLPWPDEAPYTSDLLLSMQQRLGDADYFSAIDIEPVLEESVEGVVPIRVKLLPAPRTVYTGGVFVGTDTGPGVKGGYERRWVNDRGHKLRSALVLAQNLRTLDLVYVMPQPGSNQRSYNLGAGLRDEHTSSVDARTAELVASEVRQWRGNTRTVGLHLLGGDFTVGDEKGRSVMLYPELAFVRKRGDDPSFVHHGYMASLVGRAAAESVLSDSHLLQVRADAKWITSFGDHRRLILRGALGATAANRFEQLPPQLRFFAGGDRTIRGYGYEAIGPRNDKDKVVGGKSLVVASAEVEHYFSDTWGAAAFVDAGDVFNRSAIAMKFGTGLGLRWRSPVGLVRIDLATPVSDRYESGVQLHLTIGPDL